MLLDERRGKAITELGYQASGYFHEIDCGTCGHEVQTIIHDADLNYTKMKDLVDQLQSYQCPHWTVDKPAPVYGDIVQSIMTLTWNEAMAAVMLPGWRASRPQGLGQSQQLSQ